MVRYPHIASIVIIDEILDGGGIQTNVVRESINIECRFSTKGADKKNNYKAKLYTAYRDFDINELNGQKLVFGGVEYIINEVFKYQKHTEIWLD